MFDKHFSTARTKNFLLLLVFTTNGPVQLRITCTVRKNQRNDSKYNKITTKAATNDRGRRTLMDRTRPVSPREVPPICNFHRWVVKIFHEFSIHLDRPLRPDKGPAIGLVCRVVRALHFIVSARSKCRAKKKKSRNKRGTSGHFYFTLFRRGKNKR